jgi:hypothetical protein
MGTAGRCLPWLIAIALTITHTTSASAALHRVPEDVATLSAACARAVSGDEIRLGPGSYSADRGESFPVRLPAGVTLRGAAPDRTVLDGHGRGPLLVLTGRAEVLGLTLRGSGGSAGGALRAEAGADAQVTGVIFEGNDSAGAGDAVTVDGGRLVLRNVIFRGNGRTGPTVRVDAGEADLERCTFARNGGAALEVESGSGRFVRCVVSEPGSPGGPACGVRLGTSASLIAEQNLFDGCQDEVLSAPAGASLRRGPDALRAGIVRFRDPERGDLRLEPGSGPRLVDREVGAYGGREAMLSGREPRVARSSDSPEDSAELATAPNPGATPTIRFTLTRSTVVDLGVYNVLGQRVRSLLSRDLAAGEHAQPWDGRDDRGDELPPGVYFVRITRHDVSESQRIVLAR